MPSMFRIRSPLFPMGPSMSRHAVTVPFRRTRCVLDRLIDVSDRVVLVTDMPVDVPDRVVDVQDMASEILDRLRGCFHAAGLFRFAGRRSGCCGACSCASSAASPGCGQLRAPSSTKRAGSEGWRRSLQTRAIAAGSLSRRAVDRRAGAVRSPGIAN
jgi:hypothetical protein